MILNIVQLWPDEDFFSYQICKSQFRFQCRVVRAQFANMMETRDLLQRPLMDVK